MSEPLDYRSIRPAEDGRRIEVIDQTLLPHRLQIRVLGSVADAAEAIRAMRVRGAPLIGATAAWGLCLALAEDPSDKSLEAAVALLRATRPTGVNLQWALARMHSRLAATKPSRRAAVARDEAARLCAEDAAINEAIGDHGLPLIRAAARHRPAGDPVRILTHCNAGRLATVDWGTALAPVYKAHAAGIPLLVWVDETRPRNQGAALTAWELAAAGVPHRVVVDNAGGHLMQRGLVDLCITGTDRVTANGDVCNKIGTYLKALAAHDNAVPFYVATPTPSIDPRTASGEQVPIEERDPDEVSSIEGLDGDTVRRVRLTPAASPAANYAFDITPARLVSGLITEHGIVEASAAGIGSLGLAGAAPSAASGS